MRILITSLSGHRIDEKLADYAYEAMRGVEEHEFERDILPVPGKYDQMWVFNGLDNSNRSQSIIEAAHTIPTYYFWDDHSLPIFDHMTTISQFEGLGDKHFQISELAVFDESWETVSGHRLYDFVYWGHRKNERQENYDKFIVDDSNSLLIGEWDGKKSFNAPYERDMRRLYGLLRQCTYTTVFGDDIHNGRSIPLRVYEAAMNNVIVYFDRKLVEGQKFSIDEEFIIDSVDDIELTTFSRFKDTLLQGTLEDAQKRVTQKLKEVTCLECKIVVQ